MQSSNSLHVDVAELNRVEAESSRPTGGSPASTMAPLLSLLLIASVASLVSAGDASDGVAQLDTLGLQALHQQAAKSHGVAFVRFYMNG